jgi:hypothetical protein
MKNIFIAFAFIIISLQSFAQEEDSVLIGSHFAQNMVTTYYVDGEIETEEDEYDIQFYMRPNGEIYRLEIDGTVIVSEEDDPVYSLPRPDDEEVEYIDLYIEGWNKFGDEVCEGYAFLRNPPPGSVINFYVEIEDVRAVVDLDLPQGIPLEQVYITLNGQDWNEFRYDSYWGGYNIWYSPIEIGQTYEVYYNGRVIMTGTLEELLSGIPEDPESEGSLVNVELPGGVEVVDYSQSQNYYESVKFIGTTLDGQTSLVSGEMEDAKVFTVYRNLENMRWSVGLSFRGVSSFTLTVFAPDGRGNLVMIDDPTVIEESWYGYSYVSVYTQYYQNLVLVITDVEYAYGNSFEVTFGGGKG